MEISQKLEMGTHNPVESRLSPELSVIQVIQY